MTLLDYLVLQAGPAAFLERLLEEWKIFDRRMLNAEMLTIAKQILEEDKISTRCQGPLLLGPVWYMTDPEELLSQLEQQWYLRWQRAMMPYPGLLYVCDRAVPFHYATFFNRVQWDIAYWREHNQQLTQLVNVIRLQEGQTEAQVLSHAQQFADTLPHRIGTIGHSPVRYYIGRWEKRERDNQAQEQRYHDFGRAQTANREGLPLPPAGNDGTRLAQDGS